MWRSLLAPRRLSPAAMPEGVSNSHLRRSYLRRQHDEVVTRHYSPLSNAASVNSPQYLSTTSLSADENQGRNSRGSLPRNTGSLRPASSLSDDNDRKETNGEDNDDESFSKLSAAIHSIQQRAMENDLRQSIENPKPWFSLLHYPSRAAWRSTDHMLGDARKHLTNNTEDRADNDDSDDSPLAETQFNLLKHSERTNKQLKRTYKRIVEIHSALQLKRERERRMAANYWTDHEKKWQKKQSVISEAEEAQNQHHDDDDASLMGDSTAFTTTASNSSSKKNTSQRIPIRRPLRLLGPIRRSLQIHTTTQNRTLRSRKTICRNTLCQFRQTGQSIPKTKYSCAILFWQKGCQFGKAHRIWAGANVDSHEVSIGTELFYCQKGVIGSEELAGWEWRWKRKYH